MPQRRSRRKPESIPTQDRDTQTQADSAPPQRARLSHTWNELRSTNQASAISSNLTTLIERDAPLQTHSGLVLMYGPFQAEMPPGETRGVASWLRDCVRKYGLPSLVRYDYRHRAQVFRRDEFQLWLEPLLSEVSS